MVSSLQNMFGALQDLVKEKIPEEQWNLQRGAWKDIRYVRRLRAEVTYSKKNGCYTTLENYSTRKNS